MLPSFLKSDVIKPLEIAFKNWVIAAIYSCVACIIYPTAAQTGHVIEFHGIRFLRIIELLSIAARAFTLLYFAGYLNYVSCCIRNERLYNCELIQ